ncbi:MAG: hypothetical protein RLP44_05495 [Aggregatilineales bacterium]
MVENPELPKRTLIHEFIVYILMILTIGTPLLFGFGLAVFMPTWLAPPDVNTWNTIYLYIIVCELLWLTPTILILRLRKFIFRKSHIAMIVAFVIFWGFLIFAILGESKHLLTFWMMDETATCEYHEANGHAYYDCYGYFGNQPTQPNQPYDWGVRFEGSPSIPLVKAPCLVGLCN